MAAKLSSLLADLHELIESSSHQRGAEGLNVAVDISFMCIESLSEADLALFSSLLFNKDLGIIPFLRQTATIDDFTACKEELLHFLGKYVAKMEKKVLPYAVEIKDICVSLFLRDRMNRVRVATFAPFMQLLELCLHSPVRHDLDIKSAVDKYFTACTQPSKYQPTVRAEVYHLLGIVCEVYPELMENTAPRLVTIYLNCLKEEMLSTRKKKPEMTVIAGCLRGLARLLVNFHQSVAADKKGDIYRFTKMAIDPQVSLTRYDVPKAGLYMIRRQAEHLREYIAQDHQALYGAIFKWCGHVNRDVKLVGFEALESFFRQVSKQIVNQLGKGQAADVSVFKNFIRIFQNIIDSSENPRELSIAIRGYGYFAAPCRLLMKEDDVKFMFNEMIKRSELVFSSQGDGAEESIYHLPSFMDSLASIVKELADVSDGFLLSLERLIVLLFDRFPRFSVSSRFPVYRAVSRLLAGLVPRGARLKSFISHIVYQGLIRTCSHPVLIEGENAASSSSASSPSSGALSYRDYLELWFNILRGPSKENSELLSLTAEQKDWLYTTLYDELIEAVLRVIRKLDLSAMKTTTLEQLAEEEAQKTKSEKEETFPLPAAGSDPVASLQASVPKDFQIFINLVDFSNAFLPSVHPQMFKRWVYAFGHEMMMLSARMPLVSGFYKLLTTCLQICAETKYFALPELSENAMDVDADADPDREACFTLFRKFIEEVLERVKQYKDDLQASCLRLVLAMPGEFIERGVTVVIPAVQSALKLGIGYTPLAEAALDALERWISHLVSGVLQDQLKNVLPYLDAYLVTSAETDAIDGEETASAVKKLRSSSQKVGKKVPTGALKRIQEDMTSFESRVRQLRLRIVRFLGSLGGCINAGLVGNGTVESAVAWDTKKRLDFPVPFQDMKPTIHLDPFLPRVVELALHGSDRQTKVAACELLHAMTLFVIGKGTRQPDGSHASMTTLYEKLFPAIMTLACDVEQVAVQLFKPLFLQMIHWFTNSSKYGSPDTNCLLGAIMDCLVDSFNTALRDFAAVCVKEFVSWSIKQASPETLAKSPYNIQALLKRIRNLAVHPSPFKRLGASLAFNSIYTLFREEESLVDVFVIDLTYSFLMSLGAAHKDDQSVGTQDQCKAAIAHLERIMKTKASVLSKENKKRKCPKFMTTAKLSIFVAWFVKLCGRPETELRHMAMKLCVSLAPVSDSSSLSASRFLQKCTKEKDGKFLIQCFEAGGVLRTSQMSGIQGAPRMNEKSDTFSLPMATLWLEELLAALDCYGWVFSQRLLSPSDVFGGRTHLSKLFSAVCHFVDDLSMGGIECARELWGKSSLDASVFTPTEVEKYLKIKCTVIVRLIDFLCASLSSFAKESISTFDKSLWCRNLFSLLCTAVVNPASLGFDMSDVDVIENLPKKTEAVCKLMRVALPDPFLTSFQEVVAEKIQKINFLSLLAETDRSDDGARKMSQTIEGLRQLQLSGLLERVWDETGETGYKELGAFLLKTVFTLLHRQNVKSSFIPMQPSVIAMYKRLVSLSFAVGVQEEVVLEFLNDKTGIGIHGKESTETTTLGVLFYRTYQEDLDAYFAASSRFLASLMDQATTSPALVAAVLCGVLDCATRDRKKHGSRAATTIADNWSKLESWWGPRADDDSKAKTLTVLKKLLAFDVKTATKPTSKSLSVIFKSYMTLLSSPSTLSFKVLVLDLLSAFAALPEPYESELKTNLDELIAGNFPLKSSEFAEGSSRRKEYIAALDKILAAMIASSSLVLYKAIIGILCREEEHAHEDQIQKSLALFAQKLPFDRAKTAADVAFDLFCDESRHRDDVRCAFVVRVCAPILRNVPRPAVTEFFAAHIAYMIKSLTSKLNKSSEIAMGCQLTTKLCCCEMLQVLYERLPASELTSPSGRVNKAHCESSGVAVKDGKELTKVITKACHEAKSEDTRGEAMLKDFRRRYHAAAYRTLIAVISCTQTEEKFYSTFLFRDNVAKGQLLWDNILDLEKRYEFSIELEANVKRKTKLTSIRARVHSADDSPEEIDKSFRQPHYLPSQYLADSSLCEEVSQYDFSSLPKESLQTASSLSPPDEDGSYIVRQDVMEMDDLNQHECMVPLMQLLDHMEKNKIMPAYPEGTFATEMPAWMTSLHGKIVSSQTSPNVRLFIARLIINRPLVFRPYAKLWLAPLAKLILSGDVGGLGLNYFVVDLLVTMLSWVPAKLEDPHLVGRLTDFLMLNCSHRSGAVLRNNLEIAKTMIESWKEHVTVPTRTIISLLVATDADREAKGRAGVQLLGLVLANEFAVFSELSSDERERLYARLTANVGNKRKDVYASTASVIGMIMNYMKTTEKIEESPFHDDVEKRLKTLDSDTAEEKERFINCLHLLHEQYPDFADRFMSRILFMLPHVHGVFRTKCLEMVSSRADRVPRLFLQLKTMGFSGMLRHRDEGTQLAALGIFHRLLLSLPAADRLSIVDDVLASGDNNSVPCREKMYEILIAIFDHLPAEDVADATEKTLLDKVKEQLLKGLSDREETIRLRLFSFWNQETRLSSAVVNRLSQLLSTLYSTSTERAFLGYATNLLLELTSRSPDYDRSMFDSPLSECQFHEKAIDLSWRSRHVAMTPLFAASQSQDPYAPPTPMSGLRATQEAMDFTPTQQGEGGGGGYTWLQPATQSIDPSFVPQSVGPTFATQSTLLFTLTAAKRHGNDASLSGGGTVRSTGSIEQTQTATSDVMRLKRRFVRSRDSAAQYFARREEMKKRAREERLKQQKAARDSRVVMYRKYRDGDLPDIQIKHAELIRPLQALAQRDDHLARHLFVAVFRAVYVEGENVLTDGEMENMKTILRGQLNAALARSTEHHAPFVGAVCDVCCLVKELSLESQAVSVGCLASLQQGVGIQLLEKQLLKNVTTSVEPKPKKSRTTVNAAVSSETAGTWIELSKLYKSIEDYDTVRGIFSGEIGTQTATAEALQAEARGDYQTAYRKFRDVYSRDDNDEKRQISEEVELWEDSIMACCSNLLKWKDLELFSVSQVEEAPWTETIWRKDSQLSERVLPYILRSKLKLASQGVHDEDLLSFIDVSLRGDQDHKDFLQKRHCEELALVFILQDDFDRARYYVSECFRSFLEDWCGISSLVVSSRLSRLQSLQKITEMQEFLDFMNSEGNFDGSQPFFDLLAKWSDRVPHPSLDPIHVWDDIVTHRCAMIDKIVARFEKPLSSLPGKSRGGDLRQALNLPEVNETVSKETIKLYLNIADCACQQSNYSVAKKYLSEANKAIKKDLPDNKDLGVQWIHAVARWRCHQAGNDPSPSSIDGLVAVIPEMEKFGKDSYMMRLPSIASQQCMLQGTMFDLLATALATDGEMVMPSLGDNKIEILLSATGSSQRDSVELAGKLFSKGFEFFVQAKDRAEQAQQAYPAALLALSNFCDKALRRREEADENSEKDPSAGLSLKDYPCIVTTCLVDALKLGFREARQRFPRLLQLIELYPECNDVFVEGTKRVPSWMFIAWTSQMLAILDKKEGSAVSRCLVRVAEDYPQALFYPFKMSKGEFKFDSTPGGKECQQSSDMMSRKLQSSLMDKFVSALENLTFPEQALEDLCRNELRHLLSQPPSSRSKETIQKCWQSFYNRIVDPQPISETETGSTLATTESLTGSIHKQFVNKYAKELVQKFGKDGSKLALMKPTEFSKHLEDATKKWNERKQAVPPDSIEGFSRWLAKFQAEDYSKRIEIPGQYQGWNKPLPDYHVKISSFDSNILLLKSMRLPKRIIIHGDDGKDYKFLVKGGEDLRLDQRVEQLFRIMNEILSADAACRQRGLFVQTYEVIPMTTRVGIIEWVDDSEPLKNFLESTMTNEEKRCADGAASSYKEWLFKATKGKDVTGSYRKMFKTVNRSTVELKFREFQSLVPSSLMKRAFVQMSSSPEAFLTLRSHFVRSHACLSICQYVLGIGDRHLSNFMVNKKTGGMIAIDFGHAFGSATEFLPLPELMPMRLTKQITDVLLPLKKNGQLQSTMVCTMRALSREPDILLATADVFVKEPSLDWRQFARKEAEKQKREYKAAEDDVWYPRKKIALARKKLKRYNPTFIMREDLRLGHSRSPEYKYLENILMGERQNDVRAQSEEVCDSVETQVACLIDQATDPNILGRTWIGWEPWK